MGILDVPAYSQAASDAKYPEKIPGLTPNSLRNLRAAVAKASLNTGDVILWAYGDSHSAGVGVAATSPYSNHFMPRLATRLGRAFGLPVGRGPITFTNLGSADSAVTLGAGWVVQSPTHASAVGYNQGSANAPLGTATSLDINFGGETVNAALVLWRTGAGQSGDLIYSWDGGTKVTVAAPVSAGYEVTAQLIAAPTRGTHVLNLWQAATGIISYYVSVTPRDTTVGTIRWGTAGTSGKTSGDVSTAFAKTGSASPGGFLNAAEVDLFVLGVGDNDQMQVYGAAVPTATFTSNLSAILTKVKALARKIDTIYWGPPPPQVEPNFTPRLTDFMVAAEAWGRTNEVPVVRVDQRWKDFTTSNALSMYSDNIHMNTKGQFDVAAAQAEAILTPTPRA